uniref:Uncharacterized protein n=1 Tax=Arion vulgaris TaxID=1028688 RepID=A0A0B7ADL2_9EUPU
MKTCTSSGLSENIIISTRNRIYWKSTYDVNTTHDGDDDWTSPDKIITYLTQIHILRYDVTSNHITQ